jgi:hypothetical protein
MNTAHQQFVNDFTLVTDNDSEMYDEMKSLVHAEDYNVALVSQSIQSHYEIAIGEAIAEVEHLPVSLMMRQMLNGWGSDAFDAIARYYIESFAEESTRNCDACGKLYDPRDADIEGYHVVNKCN